MKTGLMIVRHLKAQSARVWAAITEPEQMLLWWCPDAGTTLRAEVDLRPGGRYSIVFRMRDGKEYNPTGTYREVVPHQRLAFTWEWPGRSEAESLVTFVLATKAGGTELTLTHEQLPEEAVQSHAGGWNGLLDQLNIHLGRTP